MIPWVICYSTCNKPIIPLHRVILQNVVFIHSFGLFLLNLYITATILLHYSYHLTTKGFIWHAYIDKSQMLIFIRIQSAVLRKVFIFSRNN